MTDVAYAAAARTDELAAPIFDVPIFDVPIFDVPRPEDREPPRAALAEPTAALSDSDTPPIAVETGRDLRG